MRRIVACTSQRQRVHFADEGGHPRHDARMSERVRQSSSKVALVTERLTDDGVVAQTVDRRMMVIWHSSRLPQHHLQRNVAWPPARRILQVAYDADHLLLDHAPECVRVLHFRLQTQKRLGDSFAQHWVVHQLLFCRQTVREVHHIDGNPGFLTANVTTQLTADNKLKVYVALGLRLTRHPVQIVLTPYGGRLTNAQPAILVRIGITGTKHFWESHLHVARRGFNQWIFPVSRRHGYVVQRRPSDSVLANLIWSLRLGTNSAAGAYARGATFVIAKLTTENLQLLTAPQQSADGRRIVPGLGVVDRCGQQPPFTDCTVDHMAHGDVDFVRVRFVTRVGMFGILRLVPFNGGVDGEADYEVLNHPPEFDVCGLRRVRPFAAARQPEICPERIGHVKARLQPGAELLDTQRLVGPRVDIVNEQNMEVFRSARPVRAGLAPL